VRRIQQSWVDSCLARKYEACDHANATLCVYPYRTAYNKEAQTTLDEISSARSWDTNSYVQRARSLLG